MGASEIIIRGAAEHNLKHIDLTLPRNKLIVITGVSGSGKSSLAFDTLYAEGQRRYVESLSAYARQFLEQMEKPDVESIEGPLPGDLDRAEDDDAQPTLDRRHGDRDLRLPALLFARAGRPHCHSAASRSPRSRCSRSSTRCSSCPRASGSRCWPRSCAAARARTGKSSARRRAKGFVRVRVDGEMRALDEEIDLDKHKKHTIEIVVDRLVTGAGLKGRLTDSVETALAAADGLVVDRRRGQEGPAVLAPPGLRGLRRVGAAAGAADMFSFNSPYGACPDCDGLGVKKTFSRSND